VLSNNTQYRALEDTQRELLEAQGKHVPATKEAHDA